MTHQHAVWILECRPFLEYLQIALSRLESNYPWLETKQVLDTQWDWKAAVAQLHRHYPLSIKDELINWIILEQLEKIYLFSVKNHPHIPEFAEIHNKLQCYFELDRTTTQTLPIPRSFSYGEIDLVTRVSGALIIEYHAVTF